MKNKKYVVFGYPKKGTKFAKQGYEMINDFVWASSEKEAIKLFKDYVKTKGFIGTFEAEVAVDGKFY